MVQTAEKNSTVKKPRFLPMPYLAAAAVPTSLIALYGLLCQRKDAMNWSCTHISSPYRRAVGAFSSLFGHFSLAELLITLFGIWALWFAINTVLLIVQRTDRLQTLVRRLMILATVLLCILAGYFWIWGAGYRASDFSEKSGLKTGSVTVAQLTSVTERFAEKANALSSKMGRDSDGHFAEDMRTYFASSQGVYNNIVSVFPFLNGAQYYPKQMLYSKLMSRMGFTGFYFPFTGEANINTDAPACLIPATIAHEMAHQRGINAEQDANFTAIAACITSGIPVYEYSGYLLGLINLMNALYTADLSAWSGIYASFNISLMQDWKDDNAYWAGMESSVTAAASAMYDGYLKSNGQELGMRSYGACVDLIVAWLG